MMMNEIDSRYIEPTEIIDSDNPEIIDFASRTVGNAQDPIEQAVRLYYAVRDGIWYDPYSPFFLPEHYKASNVLKRGRGYCVCKASLLCALGRAQGIPSRVGFANVRNHLATKQLIEFIGSDLFVYHGFTEFYLDGKWVKATPAFNKELCQRHKVSPLEFDGRSDSVFQSYNLEKRLFMEYVEFIGTSHDIPVADIVDAWKKAYGPERVEKWIEDHKRAKGKPLSDFFREEVLNR